MTEKQFRKLALELTDAVEASHGGHPDFRVANKVFASLSPDGTLAAVKLTPEQQQSCLQMAPEVFFPCAGAWGARGYTHIRLKLVKSALARNTLRLAWENTAPSPGRRPLSR